MKGRTGDVTYAEGFAGPGVYTKGQPGSPVIAVEVLRSDARNRGLARTVRLLFVDADKRCTDLLAKQLQTAFNTDDLASLRPHHLDVDVVQGSCEPTLVEVLTRHDAWGHPILAVLDTFGGSVSSGLLRRIAKNPGSEVLITIEPQFFTRFADAADVTHGDRVFGSQSWREVAKQPPEGKTVWLRDAYRQAVAAAGFTYVLDFELVDERGVSLYLVHGTTHPQGLRKMKEAMWEVDDAYGMRYRDPRDPEQETLPIELEPQTAALRRLLLEHVRASGELSVDDLRAFALFHTVYKEGQVLPVVRAMVGAGELERDRRQGGIQKATRLRLPLPASGHA